MKSALILAGGFGTRLRPLTCTRPKPLFPLGNRPLSELIVERLVQGGVERVIFAVNYQAEKIMQYFGTGEKWGLSIDYAREKRPLGTGGPIKNAQHLLDDSPFFVLNGDVLSTIDFKDMLNFHMQHKDAGALGTIALHPVEDPSRYGAVELDNGHRILRFVEKPAPGEEPSNLINAGAYVLDPEVFEYIPENKPFSIEKEVFPIFAAQNQLYGYKFDDIWLDMGKPADYLQANKYVLDHFLEKTHSNKFISPSANIEKSVHINSSIAIGENVEIARDTHIGPYVCIGDDVSIGQGVRIENSIIFTDVQIDSFSSINNCIVGEAATLGRWVKIEGLTIIGDYCTIKDNITLAGNVTVCPWKTVSESIMVPKTIM